MQRTAVFLLVVSAILSARDASTARADYLVFTIPNTTVEMPLNGRITNQGRTISYAHPTMTHDPLILSLDAAKIVRMPTPQTEFNRAMAKVNKDADQLYKTAISGLKRGLLREYYTAIDNVLKLNPKHEGAKRVLELKAEMSKSLPENPKVEAELRKIVSRDTMRVARSNHFIVLYDTPEKPATGHKKNRAQERLALLEQAYESFILFFSVHDVPLEIPRERMKVVLFDKTDDFRSFALQRSPSLSSTSGFWDPTLNVSVFCDRSTGEPFQALEQLQKGFKDSADQARTGGGANPRELARNMKTVEFLIDIAQETADMEVVSHEAAHQLAGNTGLLPRHVMIPAWVREGLATYFESPGDATWAGMGAVNDQRLKRYRALEPDREHSDIDFIVGDQIFDYAATHGAKLQGYGQAWALTHFLMENHLKEFVTFYRMLGEMPPDVTLNQELLTRLFDKAFGSDRKALDQEWRDYMRKLKTDAEKLEEADTKKAS